VTITSEERANVITHAAGLVFSIIGLGVLVSRAVTSGSILGIVGGSVFGISLVFLYSTSTFYHMVSDPQTKRILRTLDHMAIYILIAGTYTPIVLINLGGVWGWSLFGVIWALALIGIVYKMFFTGRFETLSTLVYITMGWLVFVAVKPMLEAVAIPGLIWIAAGGLLYSIGVLFYASKKMPFHHTIWHLFVLGGSTCHYLAVLYYSLP